MCGKGRCQMANRINLRNQSGATVQWRVNFDGGESEQSGDVLAGQDNTISLDGIGLNPGQECWPLIHPEGGIAHECGDNVSYDPNGSTAVYSISGGVDNLSCTLVSPG